MGFLERFFNRGKPDQDASQDDKLSLQVLFLNGLTLDAALVTKALRAFDPSLARASFELDASTAAQGTPLGLAQWGEHKIGLVGFNAPMPAEVVEKCVQPAHYAQDLKAAARTHRAHGLLYYKGSG